jgi:putative hydrolase of the HAD superfamily
MTRPIDVATYQAWLFDLDDTLYPEREFVLSGYRAVGDYTIVRYGLDIAPMLAERFEQGERGDLFTPVLHAAGMAVGEAQVQELVAVYRSHTPILQPFPDVRPFLHQLRAAGLRIGLVSDGWHAVQRRKWEALRLDAWFDAVIFTDSLAGRASWKPSPEGFRRCLTDLGVEPCDAVYVGDNPAKDFLAPRLLGMGTIRLCRPSTEHAAVPALSVAHEAETSCVSLGDLALGKGDAGGIGG